MFIILALPKGTIDRFTIVRTSIVYRNAAQLHVKSNEKESGVLMMVFYT